MDCRPFEEAISAGIDDEDTGVDAEALESHLATCPSCRTWAERAVAVTRSARVGPAEPVPDLTGPILATLPLRRPRLRPLTLTRLRRSEAQPTRVGRLGLVMVAGLQLCLAVPALLGQDAGASVHIAHEQGSWLLALAVGFLVVAARPERAPAMLPVVAALVAALALTMAVDIAAGRTVAAAEAPHGLAFLGLGLLWLLTRVGRSTRSEPPPPAPARPRPA